MEKKKKKKKDKKITIANTLVLHPHKMAVFRIIAYAGFMLDHAKVH